MAAKYNADLGDEVESPELAKGQAGGPGVNLRGLCPGVKENVASLIGDTPMVFLNNVTAGCGAQVAVKLESLNPMASVKDRLAKSMIECGEADGTLVPGKSVLVEATSGNTGIGLAFLGALKGYRVILVMPATMSLERRCVLRAYGAELVLTPGSKGMKGANAQAAKIVKETPGAVMTSQFTTLANAKVHRETTGPEIWRQTNGLVSAVVCGVGTGGTVTGISQFLKGNTGFSGKVFAVEPQESPVMSGGKPGPHKIQGIGAGFIPDVLDMKMVDEVLQVSSDEAIATSRSMPQKEGLMVGISAGAAVAAAVQVAKRPEYAGKLVVCVLPSAGERYLSTPLFADIRAECEAMPVVPESEF